MLPVVARSQDDPPVFNFGVEIVACPNIELPPKCMGKHDLTFGGNLGLHS